MKTCSWCSNEFKPNVSYQIYCSVNCRDLASKQKISERYRANKIKNRSKKERLCSGGCGIILSAYNDEGFCKKCNVNNRKVSRTLKELRGFFDYEQK
jgi:hypothetical protein